MKQWTIVCVGILAILAILVAFKFNPTVEGHGGGHSGGGGGSGRGGGGRGFSPGRGGWGGRGRGWNNGYGYGNGGGYGGYSYAINPLDYYGDYYYDPYWTPLRQRAIAPWSPWQSWW